MSKWFSGRQNVRTTRAFFVEPKFPFELAKYEPSKTPNHIARFNALRKVEADAKGEKEKYVDLGDFIDDIDASAKNSRNTGPMVSILKAAFSWTRRRSTSSAICKGQRTSQ